MNCDEVKRKTSIKAVLESFNLFPVKMNQKTAFYFALDRKEKFPSLSVNYITNQAFDFGTGKSYDVISIVQQMTQCSVSDALKYLGRIDFPIQCKAPSVVSNQPKNYRILKINDLHHPALIEYLKLRNVYEQKDLVKEIWYVLNDKRYFGIGFFNNSGGVEIRNKYSKICLGKKDVTLIKSSTNTNNEILIFEGFFDYLSFKNLDKIENDTSDYLILNSTAMLSKFFNALKEYGKILLFLDNDRNGIATKEIIRAKYGNVEDCSLLYRDYKDLNDWSCNAK